MQVKAEIETYIRSRQSAGQQYVTQAGELRAFGNFLGDVALESVTPNEILAFLDARVRSRHTWRRKYSQIGRFFRYSHIVSGSPRVDMPLPRGMVRSNFVPHIFTRAEVRLLLVQAGRRTHAANATVSCQSFRMVLLLLYATGGRLREIIGLRRSDVNLVEATLLFGANTAGARKLPLGPELTACLRNHLNEYPRSQASAPLLVRRGGKGLSVDSIRRLFLSLCEETGVGRKDVSDLGKPRLCDLKATFAVHRIGQAICQGENLNRVLPALAHYMGYKDLLSAERFLQLTPERFAAALEKLSPEEDNSWSFTD